MEEWLTLILMLIVSMLVALRRSHQRCRSSIDARRNLLRVDSNESDLKLSNLNPILAGELLILWSTVWLQCRSRQRCKSSLYEGNCVFDWWLRIAYAELYRCGSFHTRCGFLWSDRHAPGMALGYLLRVRDASTALMCPSWPNVPSRSPHVASFGPTYPALWMWISLVLISFVFSSTIFHFTYNYVCQSFLSFTVGLNPIDLFVSYRWPEVMFTTN